MKKMVAFAMALLLCLSAGNALAAGQLEVTQENAHLIDGFWRAVYTYAKVENTGDKPVRINAGVLEVYDAEGNAINSTDWLDIYASCLQPGEYTYVAASVDIEDEQAAPVDYSLTFAGKSTNEALTYRLPCTSALELGVESEWWTYNYMYAYVTNDTQEPIYDIQVVFALLDEAGNILYLTDDSLYDERALAPGSTLIIRKDISSDFMDYFDKHGITPVKVDAIAYVEIDE